MHRCKYMIIMVVISLALYMPLMGQSSYEIITGQVLDADNGLPVPYALVISKGERRGLSPNGTTTDADGHFLLQIDSSDHTIEVRFMGYQTQTFQPAFSNLDTLNLGIIRLKPDVQSLQEVAVVAEKSTVEFKLDKRVFNVGQDLSSTGMGALEVLNRVPSVNVDIEGTVTLRGNAGVQILINGKPSVLADQQSKALSSITAEMIESVEVITNPSAKYEAEGTSGIINIVLKKDEKKGLNGSASVNTGSPNNHSVGASINYRKEQFNFFTQFGVGYRTRPEYTQTENRDLTQNTSVFSSGTGGRNEQFYNITLGTDYYLNDFNIITLSGNYAYELEDNPSTTYFNLYDADGDLYAAYQRDETTEATNPKWQYDLQYRKQFRNNEDHVLLISGLGKFFGKDGKSEFLNTYTLGPPTAPNQRTVTDYYQADYTYKLDYTNPLSKKVTLETGAQYGTNDVGSDYALFNQEGTLWVPDSTLTNNFEYNQKVLGIYGTGSVEGNKWGVKAGLRLERTDLTTLLTTTNEGNKQLYTDLFPSVHTSYKANEQLSIQAGYSRRISRPRLWDLNPFFNIQNNYNVRTGNPTLEPEYSDAYEVTGIFITEAFSLNASLYFLHTTNVVERVTFFKEDISITTPLNIGTRNKTGIEFNGKVTFSDLFTLNGDFNFGVFVRDGSYESQEFDFNGNQWSAQMTGLLELPLEIDLELSPSYQSGYKTIQGRVSGYGSADMGIRKKIWGGKGIINLSIRDIFASRKRESFVEQPGYYVYSNSWRGRLFTMGFSYSFGKGEAMTYSGGGRH